MTSTIQWISNLHKEILFKRDFKSMEKYLVKPVHIKTSLPQKIIYRAKKTLSCSVPDCDTHKDHVKHCHMCSFTFCYDHYNECLYCEREKQVWCDSCFEEMDMSCSKCK